MAIVLKDNEKLYLRGWEYNIARTLTKFAEKITAAGGRVKPLKNAIIYNRSIWEEITEIEYRLEKAHETEKNKKYFDAQRAKLETLKQKKQDQKPVHATHTSYIQFVLNNDYYYISFDSNPLLDHRLTKTPINNGIVSRDTYSIEFDAGTIVNALWCKECNNETIDNIVDILFSIATNAKYSEIHRNARRVRVPNSYNNGYHYETIYEKERTEKIDF